MQRSISPRLICRTRFPSETRSSMLVGPWDLQLHPDPTATLYLIDGDTILLRVSQLAGVISGPNKSSLSATLPDLSCYQGMAGIWWVGLSAQIIRVGVVSCVFLASVSESRGRWVSTGPESQMVGEVPQRKKGPSLEHGRTSHFRAGRTLRDCRHQTSA